MQNATDDEQKENGQDTVTYPLVEFLLPLKWQLWGLSDNIEMVMM